MLLYRTINRQVTFLLLHRCADISMLMSVDGVNDLIATTHLNFNDYVLELSDTRVYWCRQTTVSGRTVAA